MVRRYICIQICIWTHKGALPLFDFRRNFHNNFFLLILADVHKHQYHEYTMNNNQLYVVRMCQMVITEYYDYDYYYNY